MTHKQRLAKATQTFSKMKNSGLYTSLRDIDIIETIAVSLGVSTNDLKQACGVNSNS